MQHEILSLLSSHLGSPLLSSSSLIHPGELSTLKSLASLAALHKKVSTFCSSNQQTTSLSALSAILSLKLVRPYTNSVLLLEELILKGEVGSEGSVPLALVMAEMSAWESSLVGVERLLNALENGVPGSKKGRTREEVMARWTASPLITLLQAESNTGLTSLAELLKEAVKTVASIWLASFTSFLIFGRLGKEPLFIIKLPESTSSSPIPTYTFPSSSLPLLPNLSNPSTRASTLASLSTISTSLSILHSLPHGKGSSLSTKSSTLELSRGLRHRLQAILQDCSGPGDESFSSRISQAEALLSTHLLSIHLPNYLLVSNLSLLGSTYLLRTGSFASNLVSELSILRTKPRSTSIGVSTLDLTGALFRSSLGTALDPEELEATMMGLGLENFKLVLTRDLNLELEDDAFSRKLVGPSISLLFEPTKAMSLILTKECLEIYGRIWSYLMSIRSCHARLLNTWTTLSHSQRLRRRFTGRTEGGSSTEEVILRENTIRQAWGLVRSMLWFIESILGHFQIDVIDPAYNNLLERVENGRSSGENEGEGGDENEEKGSRGDGDASEGDATTLGGGAATESRKEKEKQKERSRQLDFNSLVSVHSLYLSVIVSGLLLNSEVLSSKMMEIMETCESFCGKIDRWDGDVLPGLLSGNLNDEESAQVVWERSEAIQDLNESFQLHLSDFFELLSSASTNPKFLSQQQQSNISMSHANLSIASLSMRNHPAAIRINKSGSHSSLHQNSVVSQAKLEAELATREFFPRLLLRLDFGGWFSKSEERNERREEREREKEYKEDESGVLDRML